MKENLAIVAFGIIFVLFITIGIPAFVWLIETYVDLIIKPMFALIAIGAAVYAYVIFKE